MPYLLPLLLQTALALPPATAGVIDGKEALLIWPADESGTLLDPTGCEIHLTPSGDLETHLTYPCGRWVAPPPQQRYNYWLEQGDRISGNKSVLFYSGLASDRGFLIVSGMGPAGFVNVAAGLRERETFRIISFREPDRIFDLRLHENDRHPRIRVPAGLTIGGVFDEDGNAVALTKPIDVAVGKTATLDPAKPAAGTSDLVVILQKRGSSRPPKMQAAVSLSGGATCQPDLYRENESRLFAIWFGLPPGQASVTVTATDKDKIARPVALRADRISTMRLTHPFGEK
jgi:hypothetical protein